MSRSTLPDRALQSALEFAVLIAAAGQKTRPQVPFPAGLKPFLKFHKLPPKALATVREVVENDPEYLRVLGIGAQAELVDEVGMLWLTRPDGWFEQALELLGPEESDDDTVDARAERRRREAAETAAVRSRLEVVELKEALAQAGAELAETAKERDAVAKQLRAAQSRIGELEKSSRRAAEPVAADTTEAVRALEARLAEAEAARDAALSSRADDSSSVDVDRLRALLQEALALTGAVPEGQRRSRRATARQPIGIPGGVYGNSERAGEHLLRHPGALVLIDGYNVAKLGWPDLSLEQQRDRAIEAAETLARRWGTVLHLVFDGADIMGGHARGRRLVRVSFSPEGVLADDVLRAEVAAVDPARPVVVVTNDKAVVHDVKALGANALSSDTFLTLARR